MLQRADTIMKMCTKVMSKTYKDIDSVEKQDELPEEAVTEEVVEESAAYKRWAKRVSGGTVSKRLSKAHKAIMENALKAIESAAEAESTPAYLSSALKHVCSLLKGMVEEPVEEAVDDGTGITPEEEMSLKAEMDELKSARKALGQTLLSVAGVRMGMN